MTESASPPGLVAKRAHKKSRLGCSQCKQRKIKCDERRPLCKNCERHYKGIQKCGFVVSAHLAVSSKSPHIIPPRPRQDKDKKQIVVFRRGVNVFLRTGPGSDFEPFDCLPDCHIPQKQKFLHHYLTTFISRSYPVHLDHPAQPLMQFERSNFRMVDLHIQGLKRMVGLRGGLSKIRDENHMLANMIFGVSLTVTTEVQFEPDTPLESMEPDRAIELRADDPKLFRLDNVGIAKDHVRVLKVLRYMTNVAEIEWPDNQAPPKCSEIMARTMSLREPIEEGPLIASISESMRLASISLCFLPFKNDYPSPELLINTMIYKLRSSLETMLSLVPVDHPLLPWLLSVGGIYSAQAPERNWFVGHLVPIVEANGIRSWHEMKPHLTKALWMEFFCEIPLRKLWEEVEEKRKDLELMDLDVW